MLYFRYTQLKNFDNMLYFAFKDRNQECLYSTVIPTTPCCSGLKEDYERLNTVSTKQANLLRATPGAPFWQRNYYEHIIRSEADLNRIRGYIRQNPLRWEMDQENPESKVMVLHKK